MGVLKIRNFGKCTTRPEDRHFLLFRACRMMERDGLRARNLRVGQFMMEIGIRESTGTWKIPPGREMAV